MTQDFRLLLSTSKLLILFSQNMCHFVRNCTPFKIEQCVFLPNLVRWTALVTNPKNVGRIRKYASKRRKKERSENRRHLVLQNCLMAILIRKMVVVRKIEGIERSTGIQINRIQRNDGIPATDTESIDIEIRIGSVVYIFCSNFGLRLFWSVNIAGTLLRDILDCTHLLYLYMKLRIYFVDTLICK
ncbi:hypothetical protein P879_09664 [Paragonimus westermani]|uniref:Uncharacterized protein n=1 Tax=Paragonimus westermani TaxID=34504 RepID=A0A8T0DHP9_9TREM|nr:hypothetical protein P879_09664 [Paragonimus westermani]